jgi:hypothetical protein
MGCSRNLERATHDSVAFRFIAANEHPDHDTVANFRRRFCGSMGLAQPLRGLCVTLRGTAAAQYDSVYAATFVHGSVAGSVSGGQICAAATFASLKAFQITLRNLRTTP